LRGRVRRAAARPVGSSTCTATQQRGRATPQLTPYKREAGARTTAGKSATGGTRRSSPGRPWRWCSTVRLRPRSLR